MTSKSLSFKLVLDEARRNLWALALSVLGFLFAGPLPLLIYLQRELQSAEREGIAQTEIVKKLAENFSSLFRQDFPRFGMIIMAILCGIVLFRFLHDRRQVDFYHALPIRRESLFLVKFTAGVLLVFPAYLLMRLLSLAVVAGMGYSGAIQWGEVLSAVGLDILAFFLMYSFAILCTVLCGNTFFTVALLFAVSLSLLPVIWIYYSFASWFYPAYSIAAGDIEMFSPLIVCLATEQLRFLAPHLIAAAGALVLAFVLFRRRRSERAGSALAFKPLQLPLKVYVCIVGGLGFSCILNSIGVRDNSGIWLFLFTAIGVAVLHCVMEIIYQADFRALFRKPQVLAAVTVVSLLLAAGLKADILGYSKWLPAENKVEQIALDNLSTFYATDAPYDYQSIANMALSMDANPETKQALLRLAEIGTQNLDIAYKGFTRTENYDTLIEQWKRIGGCYSFRIKYKLSGGRFRTREYTIPVTAENTALLEQVLYSEDYLRSHNEFFAYEAQKTEFAEKGEALKDRIEFWDVRRDKSVYTLRDADKLQKLTETLKADLLESDPRQVSQEGAVATLRLAAVPVDNERLYEYRVQVYPSYQRTLALMQEYSGFAPTPLRMDEIERIRVNDYRDRIRTQQEDTDGEMIDYAVDDRNSQMRIVNDPAQMAALLENAVPCENDRVGRRIEGLRLSVALTDGSQTEMYFPAGQAPEELLTELFGSALLPQPYSNGVPGTRAETAETFW